ncbi:MAG TPA: SDR family oxidoreductase [Povalibacter sp.]|uniref:SDR family NAD(P)-dependent oxidoreductase n=1 Tax=Povalibacter sp. TaxID=1962978 RepID=UPI002D13A1E0|nr:SDR family oxidoreductase [Povalibacter sp.]HMN46432.1 SDR family oxidoreductase [Povalibacter sp.]
MAGRYDDLTGRVAVVTGGSSGLGRGIALAYARAGMKVVVGDVVAGAAPGNYDLQPDIPTAELAMSYGTEALFVQSDVTRKEDVDRLIETAVQRFGRLDVMVNNAGVWRGGPFLDLCTDDLDACFSVIVRGSWLGAQAALRRFQQQGRGVLINIVSTAGLHGHVGQTPYNMAKAAQANLTRCLALEFAGSGIRVNGICPTWLKTGMSRNGAESPQFDALVRETLPAGRWGEIDDVAQAALFLASDASAFVHGVLMPLDGGESAGTFFRLAD